VVDDDLFQRRAKPVLLDGEFIGHAAYWHQVLTMLMDHFRDRHVGACIFITGCSEDRDAFRVRVNRPQFRKVS
jgi:hypothetical protein